MRDKAMMQKNADIASSLSSDQSRTAILEQMKKLGINTSAFDILTIAQLSDLLYGMSKITNHQIEKTAKKDLPAQCPVLSLVDKKLLREMIVTKGDISVVALSRSLGVPLTTLQRRRKRLEELLNRTYHIRYEKFGMKQVTFVVSTEGQGTARIGEEVLSLPGISKVVHILSSAGDLRVEAIVQTNNDLAQLCEQIKSIKGVRNIFWMESIEEIGEKKETILSLIGLV
jgi:DNA-binding Lrp family transcriptional regulator